MARYGLEPGLFPDGHVIAEPWDTADDIIELHNLLEIRTEEGYYAVAFATDQPPVVRPYKEEALRIVVESRNALAS